MILETLLSGRGRFITHFLVWLLVAVVMFYLIATVKAPYEAFWRMLLNISFGFAVFYFNGRVLVNRFFEKKRYWLWGFLSVSFWLVMAAGRTWSERLFFGGSVFNNNLLPDDGGWRVFLVTALVFFILMVFSGLYQLLENRRELESLHAEAQVNYLKAQINPHFLFNTLNNIYSAATLQHPNTPDMVLLLSELLRYVTYDSQAKQVPVEKEIEHIRAYIRLFMLKSEHLLPISLNVEGPTRDIQIEPLILLPLVENAFKHSDIETNPNGRLLINLTCDRRQLHFEVENTFDPSNTQRDEVGGVGLANIKRRLALLHKGRYQLNTEVGNGVYYVGLRLLELV